MILQKHAPLCLVAAALLAGCSDSPWSELQPPPGPNASLSDAFAAEQATGGISAFTRWIYPALAKEPNFVFSPYAVWSGLAACAAGAEGPTAEELAVALRLPPDRSLIPKGITIVSGFVPTQQDPSTAGYLASTGIWARQGTSFLPSFLAQLEENYGVTASSVDFSSESAVGTIASHLQNATGLPNVELPVSVGQGDAIDLMSHATVRGHWLHPFVSRQTLPQEFWLTPERSVEATMLRTVDAFMWTWNWGVDVVDVAYVGEGLSLILLVPREKDGVAQIEAWFPDSLSSWLDRLQESHMDLMVPRFHVESRYDLKGMLKALGARSALASGADFGKLAENAGFLTAIGHGASIDMGERGSGVSDSTPHAAPGLEGVRSRLYVSVHAQHPFLFLVVERTRNTVLLVGKVSDPRPLDGGA